MFDIESFKVTSFNIIINYYDGKTDKKRYVTLKDFEKWARSNDRLKVLSPVYEGGNLVDHDEMPIAFDTYIDLLDKDEIKLFLQSRV